MHEDAVYMTTHRKVTECTLNVLPDLLYIIKEAKPSIPI